jgi:lysozyme family protein
LDGLPSISEPDLVVVLDTLIIPIVEPLPEPIKPTTMASFDIAYQIVARHEGGYQKITSDPGNYNTRKQLVGTNWGISAVTYEDYLGYPPSEAKMRQMTKETAKRIYRTVFWDGVKGNLIKDQQVANFMFDGYVNHRSTGVKLMQRVLGVAVDGGFGPQTLAALNSANPFQVFEAFKKARVAFYHSLAGRRPSMKAQWLPVWLRRMASFVYQSGNSSTGGGNPNNSPDIGGAGALLIIPLGIALFLALR